MSCFGGDKEEKVTVYDASLMYFDEYGNIRHSGKPSDRDAELKMIMMADKDEDPVRIYCSTIFVISSIIYTRDFFTCVNMLLN